MRENAYQVRLIKKLRNIFQGCVILKNDANYMQGIPDLIILYEDRWAMLEVKMDPFSNNQPNQEYYVQKMDEMSFAAFICPETEGQVLDALQRSFRPGRHARVS